jgi:rubrerythrin
MSLAVDRVSSMDRPAGFAAELAAQGELDGYRCERCGHEWMSWLKDEEPRVCPKYKSPYWSRPRRSKKD